MATPVQTTAGLEPAFQLSDYYPIFLYALAVLAFAAASLAMAYGIGPRKRTPVKLMPYESGMDPVGSARMQFDVKFYLIAISFLIFDVELLFLYPWAVTAYAEGSDPAWREAFGRATFFAVLGFIGLLTLAYVYEWRKGAFRWR